MNSSIFALHPQLEKDCIVIGDLPLCRVLLMNDSRFPWLILVPRVQNLREIFDLQEHDYSIVMQEIRRVTQTFAELTRAHKMNVATLGNVVPQLHIHIIVRQTDDVAWPGPVWNIPSRPEPYQKEKILSFRDQIHSALNMS